jgi:hypothetical protein
VGTKIQVVHLDDQRAEAIDASLRVELAAREVCCLAWPDRNSLVIGRCDPTAALEADEELTEASDVPTDLTARANVHDMDVRVAGPTRQFSGARRAALKVDDGRHISLGETKDDQ